MLCSAHSQRGSVSDLGSKRTKKQREWGLILPLKGSTLERKGWRWPTEEIRGRRGVSLTGSSRPIIQSSQSHSSVALSAIVSVWCCLKQLSLWRRGNPAGDWRLRVAGIELRCFSGWVSSSTSWTTSAVPSPEFSAKVHPTNGGHKALSVPSDEISAISYFLDPEQVYPSMKRESMPWISIHSRVVWNLALAPFFFPRSMTTEEKAAHTATELSGYSRGAGCPNCVRKTAKFTSNYGALTSEIGPNLKP